MLFRPFSWDPNLCNTKRSSVVYWLGEKMRKFSKVGYEIESRSARSSLHFLIFGKWKVEEAERCFSHWSSPSLSILNLLHFLLGFPGVLTFKFQQKFTFTVLFNVFTSEYFHYGHATGTLVETIYLTGDQSDFNFAFAPNWRSWRFL